MDLDNVIATTALAAVLSAIVGYIFGAAKFFREQKQKAYVEILPPIVKMVFDSRSSSETEFSRALMKLWLYGSKEVARKMDRVISILHNPEQGNVMSALQEAIAAMRADIQFSPWQRLGPDDVKHLYTKIVRE